MTLKQLLSETAALGFDDGCELDSGFVFAANRALRLIASEHATMKERRFFIPTLDISLYKEKISIPSDESITVTANGKAYSFRAFGRGTLFVKDGDINRALPFDLKGGTLSGLINHKSAVFSIYPSSKLEIFDFTVFSSLDTENNIPVCEVVRVFDIKEQIPDFSYAVSPPKDASGKIPEGVFILGEKIKAPKDFSGEITIAYKPQPPLVCIDYPEKEIETEQRYVHLLPILTAAYRWLDDDSDKAAYYMQIYKEESQKMRLFQKKDTEVRYTDYLGWTK